MQSDSFVVAGGHRRDAIAVAWLARCRRGDRRGVVWLTWKAADRPADDLGPGGGQLTRIVSSEYQTIDPALSADRRMLTYAASDADGRIDLFSARVAGGGRVQLTNDAAREEAPKFSPDGERIAFTRRDADNPSEIRIVPALGGDVAAAIPNAAYPAWSPMAGASSTCGARTRALSSSSRRSPDGPDAARCCRATASIRSSGIPRGHQTAARSRS